MRERRSGGLSTGEVGGMEGSSNWMLIVIQRKHGRAASLDTTEDHRTLMADKLVGTGNDRQGTESDLVTPRACTPTFRIALRQSVASFGRAHAVHNESLAPATERDCI